MEVTDLKRLTESAGNVPSSEKQLEACLQCGLILGASQWRTVRGKGLTCPNTCEPDTTPNFSGMISIMHPSSSWVAKWNNKEALAPGIYAMSVKNEDQDDYEE